MTAKERISIEEFDDKSYRARLTELEDKAVLTHYLHNIHIDEGISSHYKKNALSILENFLNYKQKNARISMVSERAMQQLLFEVTNVSFPTPKDYAFRFIDLFAGVGGFRLALQNCGGRCVFTSEWNKNAQKTYRANFGEIPFGDLTNQDVKDYIPQDFDILCAGFPCQAFSIAGFQRGFSDTRGTLFFDVEQIVEKHRPKMVFLENVKNLITHDKGKTFRVILEILEKKLQYKVFHKVLNSMTHANVAQNRERVFVVAFAPEQVVNCTHFKFPTTTPLTKTIHDFIDPKKQADKYYYSTNHKYYPELKKFMKSKDTVYQWRRVYLRENKNKVCPTLTANMGTGGHNVPLIKDDFGFRKLTPKERFMFQGYPMDKYILPKIADSKLYIQAGNSVTTTLVERIGKEILKVI